MPSFHEISTSQLLQALKLREQIESLQQKLTALLQSVEAPAPTSKAKTRRGGRRSSGI